MNDIFGGVVLIAVIGFFIFFLWAFYAILFIIFIIVSIIALIRIFLEQEYGWIVSFIVTIPGLIYCFPMFVGALKIIF